MERAIWVPALLLSVAAGVVIASKAAMAIGLILLAVLGVAELRYFLRHPEKISRKALLGYAALAVVALAAAIGFGWHAAASRWSDMATEPYSWNERVRVYGVCLRMLPDSGVWGFGPGNFMITFRHYTLEQDAIPGLWRWAHEDYLQTVIEWGWFGAVFWSVILLGGIIVGLRSLKRGRRLPLADRMFLFAAFIAVTGITLHAAIDFPLQVASLQLYAAIALGLLWGSSEMVKGLPPSRAEG